MQFKNIKKAKNKAESSKFPRNSRLIPAKLSITRVSSTTLIRIYRGALKVFIALIFIFAAVIVGLDLESNIKSKQSVDLEREQLTKELKFWEDFIAKHQDYRDAYFQASILEYKLGDTSKAKIYVEKGLSLDPNSENGKKLDKFLEGK